MWTASSNSAVQYLGDNPPAVNDHEIEEEWQAALTDAQLLSDDCRLFLSDVPAKTGRGAQWWEPGMVIELAPEDDLVTEQLATQANSLDHINRHRIILRRPDKTQAVSVARLAGKLRHELEHVRQWNACGPPPFDLSNLADNVLALKITGLPSGRVFTNLKPTEQDANAASAMFLRARFPESVPIVLSHPEDAPLARSLTPPAPTATLVRRMVAFLYVYEDLCVEFATKQKWTFGFAYHLDDIAPGATKLWEALETIPIESSWGPGGPPPLNPTQPDA